MNKDKPTYKVGSNFMKILEKMCAKTDKNLHEYLDFRVNEKKRVLYVNGSTYSELFMSVMIDYLKKIPYVNNLCEKHYIFGVGCIEFSLNENLCEELNYEIPSSDVLNECLIDCYKIYFESASKYEKFSQDIRTHCESIINTCASRYASRSARTRNMLKTILYQEWEKTNNEWIKIVLPVV